MHFLSYVGGISIIFKDCVIKLEVVKVMHSREFHRRYAYSPLKYFHVALKTLYIDNSKKIKIFSISL